MLGDGFSAAHCQFSPCGGDALGEWEIQSLCVDNPENMFSMTGMPPECSDVFRAAIFYPSGRFILREDQIAQANIVFTADLEVAFSGSCLLALGGYRPPSQVCAELEASYIYSSDIDGAECHTSSDACLCQLTSSEISLALEDGYRVQGIEMLFDDGTRDLFCVSGEILTIREESSGVVMVMTLRRLQGTAGTAGTGGAPPDELLPPCNSDKDCTPIGLLCDIQRGVCVQCLNDTDCGEYQSCESGECATYTHCLNSLDCTGEADGKTVCDLTQNRCVECILPTDCPPNHDCLDRHCLSLGNP